MGRLSAADYRDILEFLRAAGEVEDADPFPEPLLGQLRRLVPCDVLTYGEYDPEGSLWRRSARVRVAGAPLAPVTPAIREAQRRLRHEYPHPPSGPSFVATLRWSDRLSSRALRKLELYWQVGRPLCIDYSLTAWLRDSTGRPLGYFAFDRLEPDFSDRDLLVLETLRPHLVQLARNAERRLPAPPDGLTAREHEILTWVARGKENREIAALLHISPGTVHKHLDNIYEKLGVHNRAEAIARTTNPRS